MQRISHYHVKMMLQHAIHDMLWLQETKDDIWGFVGLWTMGVKSVDGVMQLCDGCAVLSVLVCSVKWPWQLMAWVGVTRHPCWHRWQPCSIRPSKRLGLGSSTP